jgi:hypothetical protein
MSIRHRVDKYKVRVYGTDLKGNEWRWASKIIDLYSENIHVATCYFVRKDGRSSGGDDSGSSGQISFIAPEDQYESVIDLLRNENPVFINWLPKSDSQEPNDGDAFFETLKEKAGEGEVSEPRERIPVDAGILRKPA